MTLSSKELIEQKIEELGNRQPWNHNFALPGGIQTKPGKQKSHGKNEIKLQRLKEIFNELDLHDKSILDVGCNEGFFSIYMAQKGANVHGIDIDKDRIEKAEFVNKIIDGKRSLKFELMDIYSNDFKNLPKVDVCLCLGFLHRVPDPYVAIKTLSEKCNIIIFEWKALKHGPHDDAFSYFSDKPINNTDYYGTEYWLLSFATIERMLKRFGFTNFHRIDDSSYKRAILIAGNIDNEIFNKPDKIKTNAKFMSILRHTKRYLKTIIGVLSGRINA